MALAGSVRFERGWEGAERYAWLTGRSARAPPGWAEPVLGSGGEITKRWGEPYFPWKYE